MKKIALLFGGKSPEHDVSIRSARNIAAAIDRQTYELLLIGVDKKGAWFLLEGADFPGGTVTFDQGEPLVLCLGDEHPVQRKETGKSVEIDACFPIIHGPYGEDGTLQGLLKQLDIAFVGPDVLGSAVAMDKDISKRLLREADLLVSEYMCFHYYEKEAIDFVAVKNQLGLPVFIKPANMGSSVGVRKAENKDEFEAAVKEAFRYDHKIVVEEMIVGRELECAVLGNAQIACTDVGEVDMSKGFYTYEAKYESDDEADVIIPAPNISGEMRAKLTQVARAAYRVHACEGLTRVDMFLCEDGRVYVNELNTLPGFTSISMYPKLWDNAGTSYPELISELIELAIERHEREKKLEKTR